MTLTKEYKNESLLGLLFVNHFAFPPWIYKLSYVESITLHMKLLIHLRKRIHKRAGKWLLEKHICLRRQPPRNSCPHVKVPVSHKTAGAITPQGHVFLCKFGNKSRALLSRNSYWVLDTDAFWASATWSSQTPILTHIKTIKTKRTLLWCLVIAPFPSLLCPRHLSAGSLMEHASKVVSRTELN